MVSRYYQLLSGHAAIGSFHYDRMTGLLRRESSKCQWCGAGARESRHHICRVQGVGAAETEAVGESGEGLWVEAPKGTCSAKAVERRSYRGGTGVPERHTGLVLHVGRRMGGRECPGRSRWARRGRREMRAAQGRPRLVAL